MHFDRYTKSKFLEKMYSEYLIRYEYSHATVALGAYDDNNQFRGAIFGRFNDEALVDQGFFNKNYSTLANRIVNIGFGSESGVYDQVNDEMLRELKKRMKLDGELSLFAVDPEANGQGVGSKLLAELSRRYSGKNVYLYTDSNCTYQFYEHKGFIRDFAVRAHEPSQPLNQKMMYFIYHKKL